jgi:hypothetical protein
MQNKCIDAALYSSVFYLLKAWVILLLSVDINLVGLTIFARAQV